MWLLILQTVRQDITSLFTLFTQALQIKNVKVKYCHVFRTELCYFNAGCCYITCTGCSSLQTIASPSLSHRRCTAFPLQDSGMFRVTLNQQVHHLQQASSMGYCQHRRQQNYLQKKKAEILLTLVQRNHPLYKVQRSDWRPP